MREAFFFFLLFLAQRRAAFGRRARLDVVISRFLSPLFFFGRTGVGIYFSTCLEIEA